MEEKTRRCLCAQGVDDARGIKNETSRAMIFRILARSRGLMRNVIEGLVPKAGRCAQNAYASGEELSHPETSPDLLSGLVASKTAGRVLLLLVLGLCAITNLP